MRLIGHPTRSLGRLMAKSNARRRRARLGIPQPTATTTLRHPLVFSFRFGPQAFLPTVRERLSGVVDLSTGTARILRTTDTTTQASMRSRFSATTLLQARSPLDLHRTSTQPMLAQTTLLLSPTNLRF